MSGGQRSFINLYFMSSLDTALVDGGPNKTPIVSESITASFKKRKTKSSFRGFAVSSYFFAPESIEGEIVCEASPIILGNFLSAIFKQETNVNSGSVYTKRFRPQVANHSPDSANHPLQVAKYLSLPEGYTEVIYRNLNATKFSLSVAAGETVKCSLGVVGGNYYTIASSESSAADHFETPANWSTVSLSMNGAAVDYCTKIEINYSDSVEGIHFIGSRSDPSKYMRTGQQMTEIGGTFLLKNKTEFERFLEKTGPQVLNLNCEIPTEVQSGYNNSIAINIPRFHYEEIEPTINSIGQYLVDFKGVAEFDDVTSSTMEITHVSSHSSFID